MSNSRRQFIKNTAVLAGALGFSGIALEAADHSINLKTDDNSEDFWKLVREQFPLTHERVFLNNGTIGPSPFPVIQAVSNEIQAVESLAKYGGNEDPAIRAIAELVNCSDKEISLTRNVTEGINIICWGLNLKAGDEVLMTKHEHVGNAGPWLNRARVHGIVIKTVDLGQSAQETLDNVKKVISKKTKVIALPHIPCTNGQILPMKEICTLAKEKGIYSFVDGAHPPGMLQLNLKDLGCDFYASCCHKWMSGPKGTGFLFVAENKRNDVQAYYAGGGVDTGWDILKEPPVFNGYVDNGHRFFYGTQNYSLFVGITEAVTFQKNIGIEKIEKRVKSLSAYLQEQMISQFKNIEMLTPTEEISRGAVIAFKLKNKDMGNIQSRLLEKKIVTRYVPENQINCLRVSTHYYNNREDIHHFLEELDKLNQL